MVVIPSAVPLTDAAIRELADFRCEAGALSFYVDLDRRQRPSWDEVEEAAARLARRARHLPGAPRPGSETASDVDIVLARFGQGVDRAWAKGIAVFSCVERNFFRQYALAAPVGDLVVFSRRFRIVPLQQALAAETRVVAALVDRQRCRIFHSHLGRTVEVAGPADPSPRAVDTGCELGGFSRQTEEALRRHVRRSVDALAREAGRRPTAPILLGGTEPAVSAVERHLPPALRRRLGGVLPVPVDASLDEVATAMSGARLELARNSETQAVEWICDLAGHGRGAVAGLGPALQALRQHRVDTLVVSRSLAVPAASCPSCGWLGEPAILCPDCGAVAEAADGFDLSLEEAAAQRARVVFADQPRLDELGGIAVLERF